MFVAYLVYCSRTFGADSYIDTILLKLQGFLKDLGFSVRLNEFDLNIYQIFFPKSLKKTKKKSKHESLE